MRTILGFLLLLSSGAATADDFRGHSWGETIASVKAAEKAPLTAQNGDTLMYKDTLAGLHVAILYTFSNGRLVEASYMSQEVHTNKNDFIKDYKNLKELLTKKYGTPVKDDNLWRNELYKSDPAEWGMAVSVGHLIYKASWETDRTTIMTGLRGDNFQITHGVIYQEKASQARKKEEDDKATMDRL
jgi:hypothetical protein